MRGDELRTSDYMCVFTVFFVFVCGIKLQPQVAFLKANQSFLILGKRWFMVQLRFAGSLDKGPSGAN